MQTDPISDMLNRVRTATAVAKSSVDVPHSNFKRALADLLSSEGYLGTVEEAEVEGRKVIRIALRYGPRRTPVIHSLKRVSRPGRRMYAKAQHLPVIRGGLGLAIVSTPEGLLIDSEARRRNVGGEIICEVW